MSLSLLSPLPSPTSVSLSLSLSLSIFLSQNGNGGKVVVYDESASDPKTLSTNNTAYLVIMSLSKLGKTPLLLKGQ